MKREEVREEVFALRPAFGDVVETWGQKTLVQYYSQVFPALLKPSSDILDVVQRQTASILGQKIGEDTRVSLNSKRWVNTADHHGLLNHPYFYTTALARSAKEVRGEDPVVLTLPFGGVSLGNDSFPRGFSFHTQGGQLERIFFKSLMHRRMPVYALAPMAREDLVSEQSRSHMFTMTKQGRIQLDRLFEAFLSDARVWEQETYSAQLTVMNSIVWRILFNESRGDFVYLEIDSVVRELLIEKHLIHRTPIFELLFNTTWRESFVDLFEGVMGSHTSASGTHLFWYIDYQRKTRRRLVIDKDTLTTIERDVVISLTPESIAEGLLARTLMPSTALMMIVIQGIEQLACGGGPSQLAYLGHMMNQWNLLVTRFGYSSSVPNSRIYCGDNALFSIVPNESSEKRLATLIDVLLYVEEPDTCIEESLSTTPLGAVVDALLPELYCMYTNQKIEDRFLETLPRIEVV